MCIGKISAEMIICRRWKTEDVESRDIFMNGINQSYEYENMRKYDVKELEISNELEKISE